MAAVRIGRIYDVRDYRWTGSAYSLVGTYGPGSWRTDQAFTPWFSIGPVITYQTNQVQVYFKFQYRNSDGFIWYGPNSGFDVHTTPFLGRFRDDSQVSA